MTTISDDTITAALANELADYRKFRYMGDCKCGNCQLIPLPLLNRTIEHLQAIADRASSDGLPAHWVEAAQNITKLDNDPATRDEARGMAMLLVRTLLADTPPKSPVTDACIDCDGSGSYPTGAACKSCAGSGRVPHGDGIPGTTLTSGER